ncbi:acyltransferase family protein [Myxococcota bacterium]|nr:acyltransferase family protein [Myxococcota bacterium]
MKQSINDELEAQLSDFFDAASTYMFTPLTLLKFSKMLFKLDNADPEAGFRPERRDPDFVLFAARLLKKFTDVYFRPEISGLTTLPETGPGLIIGNHNGGLVPVDTFLVGGAIVRHFGGQRPLYALAHDFLFREPTLSNVLERMGTLRASHRGAELAFERDGLVIVYPGGDHETFRPYTDRHKIDFGERKGFIKLALRRGVPIYPVVSIGCHEMFYVLTRGEKIAQALGLPKAFRTSVFPIVFSLPWGLTSGFLPYLPLPKKIHINFLPPHHFDYPPEAADSAEIVDKCYHEVHLAMQDQLSVMASARQADSPL